MTLDLEAVKKRILDTLTELVAIPSVTGTDQEARAADWIAGRLRKSPWFSENPECLRRMTCNLPEAEIPMEAVFALVRTWRPTRKTLLFIGHFDVVDPDVYGSLQPWAYDPEILSQKLRTIELPPQVGADLESGRFLFGRGTMDMKAGVAIEMDILEEFAENRDLYDVNLAMLIVGDEEGNNGGMRAAVPLLTELCEELGLDIEAVINTEPSDAGLPGNTEPVIFSGTMGKVMPFFYALGQPSHVGSYFQGLSSALLISRITALVEADPEMADSAYGETTLPPICLAQGTRERGYSVTVPDRAYAYFNYVTVGKTPSEILEEMTARARKAAAETCSQLETGLQKLQDRGYSGTAAGNWNVKVMTFDDLAALAERNPAYSAEMEQFLDGLNRSLDLREQGLRLVEKTLDLAGIAGPLVVVGMLPPFLPQRTSLGDSLRERALRKALKGMKERALSDFGISFKEVVFFAGLCDLSYVGSDLTDAELHAMAASTPGWGSLYSVPIEAMKVLDCPVVNVGPEGRDAHKMTERLELDYSLRRLPVLLRELISGYGAS